MYRGKHTQRKKRTSRKTALLLASLVLIAVVAVGATVAYLIDDTASVENTFQPAQVSCSVEESFDGKVKSDVYIQNTSNIDAFIRAEILVNWVNQAGEIVPTPEGYSYVLSVNSADWTEKDGYYYYKSSVKPNDNDAGTKTDCTTNLISSVYPTLNGSQYTPQADDAYYLQVDIIADAIQAEPVSVVTQQWGYTPAG